VRSVTHTRSALYVLYVRDGHLDRMLAVRSSVLSPWSNNTVRSPLIRSVVISSPIGSGTNFSLVPPTKHCTSSSNTAAYPSFVALERSLWFVVMAVSVVPFLLVLLLEFSLLVSKDIREFSVDNLLTSFAGDWWISLVSESFADSFDGVITILFVWINLGERRRVIFELELELEYE